MTIYGSLLLGLYRDDGQLASVGVVGASDGAAAGRCARSWSPW